MKPTINWSPAYKWIYQVKNGSNTTICHSLSEAIIKIGKMSNIDAEYYKSNLRRLEDKKPIKPIPNHLWKGQGWYKDNKLIFGEKDKKVTINNNTFVIEAFKVFEIEPVD